MFCPHCGSETELVIGTAAATAETVSAEVRVAEINAARDIELAKIASRQERDWNETRVAVTEIETAATVAAAEVEGEIIAAATAAPDTAPASDPIVIDAPAIGQETDVIEDAPPENDAPAPAPPGKSSIGLGMW